MRTAWVLALLGACGGGSGKLPFDDASTSDPRKPIVSVRATPNRNVDLLFVIDDSGSMTDKQNNLVNNFPNFINTLNQIEGGLPDLHLGVVTTDMGVRSVGGAEGTPIGAVGQGGCAMSGKNGKLQTNGASVSGTFISDIKQTDGTRLKNYTGDLATVFSQMARVGATGCGFEQPLHAMRRALDPSNNPGFLRPDAILAVVFLADEDDCTIKDTGLFAAGDTLGPLTSFRCTRFGVRCATGGTTSDEMNQIGAKAGCTSNAASPYLEDVAPFRDFLLSLKSDTSKVAVGGIIGNPEPFAVEQRQINGMNQTALARSCTYQAPTGVEVADPGTRLKAFFDLFPNRSTTTTICQPDLSGGLQQLGQLVTRSIGSPCITQELADVDAQMAGLQVDCVVEDVVGVNATVIPKCSTPDTPPCWRIDTDPAGCPSGDHLKLTIVRTGAPDPATVTNMRCVVP